MYESINRAKTTERVKLLGLNNVESDRIRGDLQRGIDSDGVGGPGSCCTSTGRFQRRDRALADERDSHGAGLSPANYVDQSRAPAAPEISSIGIDTL